MKPEDDPLSKASIHAESLNHKLGDIDAMLRKSIPPGESPEFSRQYVDTLIDYSRGLLHQMWAQKLRVGQPVLADYLLNALKEIEKAGPQYSEITEKLSQVICCLPDCGLSISGYDLSDGSHTSRIR